MKRLLFFLLIFCCVDAYSQNKAENIIIVTTDGFRWQEVFKGMDSAIANNKKFNQRDSDYIFNKYWADDETERRKKLMPFLWSTVENKGQIYGNRQYGNKVDNANPYWFSYPGYNEIMTGYPDTVINSNGFPPNPNENVLDFLNRQSKLKGRIAAFTAWDAFDRILNEKRSGFPVIAAFDSVGGANPSTSEKLINAMKDDSPKPWMEDECLDVFTHYAAEDYLKTKKPKVLYISYGETDEWAHAGFYRYYLDAAHQVDAWLEKLWNIIQADPMYKNKTVLFVTVDHGRGDIKKEQWTSHNNKIADSHQIWFAAMGPGIKAKGEIKDNIQIFQKQFAQTIAKLLGYTFKADHPIADPVSQLFE